jgi:large subunit ribosomal protein L24
LDVSALAGWLALRAVDQQSKKLEQIEAERAGRASPPPASPIVPVRPPSASAAPPTAPKAAAPLPAPLEIKPAPRPAAPQRPASSLSDRDRFFNSQR